jgi:PqqD family protein of HPr-rel-A system
MKWQLVAAHAVKLRAWDDELIVFNYLSGDTHLLGDAAGHIVAILQHSPADDRTIAAELCRRMQFGRTDEVIPEVGHILAELKALNLVEEVA